MIVALSIDPAIGSETTYTVASAPESWYSQPMPDDLYHRDVLAWSQHQADLLRRVGRGERVNGVDWDQVAEEIEDLGLSELNALRSFLRLTMVHLLKIYGWPDSSAVGHWRGEIVGFQSEAAERFAPSMRQKIDVEKLYGLALKQIARDTYDAQPPRLPPDLCPFSLDQLLTADPAALEEALPGR